VLATATFIQLLNTTSRRRCILRRDLIARLVADRWELDRASLIGWGTVSRSLSFSWSGSSGTIIIGLAGILLFLLASLPLLTNFLEFFWSALVTVGLHGYMGIEMIQGTISLLAAVPSTLVHALDLLITTTRALVLLGTRDWDEGIDL
jgi:hypothetical protein